MHQALEQCSRLGEVSTEIQALLLGDCRVAGLAVKGLHRVGTT